MARPRPAHSSSVRTRSRVLTVIVGGRRATALSIINTDVTPDYIVGPPWANSFLARHPKAAAFTLAQEPSQGLTQITETSTPSSPSQSSKSPPTCSAFKIPNKYC